MLLPCRNGGELMKASNVVYDRATSTEHALELLENHGADAKILAGGQSLIPMMNLRLARPTRLIDIGGIQDLAGVDRIGDGLRCGAMTRHITVERAAGPQFDGFGALSAAARHIGHYPIRTRGTIGGSIAHADSTSEWCLMALALGAQFEIEGPRGARRVDAEAFFKGFFTTDIEPDELLTAVRFPGPTRGTSLVEYARRRGDFAIVAIATHIELDAARRVKQVRIALGGVAGRPIRQFDAESVLSAVDTSDSVAVRAAIDEAVYVCASGIENSDDVHATAEYRRRLTSVLLCQSLEDSLAQWRKGAQL